MCEEFSLARGSVTDGCHKGVILGYYGRHGGGWQGEKRISNMLGARYGEAANKDTIFAKGQLHYLLGKGRELLLAI